MVVILPHKINIRFVCILHHFAFNIVCGEVVEDVLGLTVLLDPCLNQVAIKWDILVRHCYYFEKSDFVAH